MPSNGATRIADDLLWCFGPAALWHEAMREVQGVGPLDDSDSAQFHANYCRSSCARNAIAVARALV